jgi:hypothetical protein
VLDDKDREVFLVNVTGSHGQRDRYEAHLKAEAKKQRKIEAKFKVLDGNAVRGSAQAERNSKVRLPGGKQLAERSSLHSSCHRSRELEETSEEYHGQSRRWILSCYGSPGCFFRSRLLFV